MNPKMEQLDDRLNDLGAKPKGYEWTLADYQTVLKAYRQADQTTKDQVWAMLRGSKVPR